MSTVVHSARLVDGAIADDAWVRFGDDGRVADAGTGEGWRGRPADEIVDAAGGLLTPGFIDLHGHGGAGVSYDDGPDAVLPSRAPIQTKVSSLSGVRRRGSIAIRCGSPKESSAGPSSAT